VIFIAIAVSVATLKPTREQLRKGVALWLKRAPAPILTIIIYFCVSFVMSGSAMNEVLGETLVVIFGSAYIYVSASLGFLGAIVGALRRRQTCYSTRSRKPLLTAWLTRAIHDYCMGSRSCRRRQRSYAIQDQQRSCHSCCRKEIESMVMKAPNRGSALRL
jgi:hypothetical protein